MNAVNPHKLSLTPAIFPYSEFCTVLQSVPPIHRSILLKFEISIVNVNNISRQINANIIFSIDLIVFPEF